MSYITTHPAFGVAKELSAPPEELYKARKAVLLAVVTGVCSRLDSSKSERTLSDGLWHAVEEFLDCSDYLLSNQQAPEEKSVNHE